VAKTRRRANGRYHELDVSAVNGSGTGDLVKSGDPGAVGQIPFVAVTDEDSAGKATVDTEGVYELSVLGHDGTANAAIAAGDKLVWDNTGGTVEKTPGSANSVPFGYALGAVASGATTAINVRLQPGA
jgi:predicted RecA/RadA family phage recombinase